MWSDIEMGGDKNGGEKMGEKEKWQLHTREYLHGYADNEEYMQTGWLTD